MACSTAAGAPLLTGEFHCPEGVTKSGAAAKAPAMTAPDATAQEDFLPKRVIVESAEFKGEGDGKLEMFPKRLQSSW